MSDLNPNRPRSHHPEPPPARPVRTVEIKTFPRFTDAELAAFLRIPFVGTCS